MKNQLKKSRVSVLIVICCLFFSYLGADANEEQTISSQIEAQPYIEISYANGDKVFLDTVKGLSFSTSGSSYTVFSPDTIVNYDIFNEIYDDEIETTDIFELSSYFHLSELNRPLSEIKNNSLTVSQPEEDTKFILKFDNENRPISYTNYLNDKEDDSYSIRYLSVFGFYVSYYFRKLQEPIFYTFYALKDTTNFGIVFGVILILSFFLLVWSFVSFTFWLYRRITKRKISDKKSAQLLVCAIDFITIYTLLSFTSSISLFVICLYPAVWGTIVTIRLIRKKKNV